MHTLQTAVLEHTTHQGVHHDWLIENPSLANPQAPDARLWTARVGPPPSIWGDIRRFEVEVIAPHRRDYLHDQGPISGGRGRVRRVAEGVCVVRLWSDDRILICTDLLGDRPVTLLRLTGKRWIGCVSESARPQAASYAVCRSSCNSSGGTCWS